MAQISDFMDDPWWRNMYYRNLIKDPVNPHYSNFNQSGLNTPITVESNQDYVAALNRHKDGLDAYRMGAVSNEAKMKMGSPMPLTMGVGPRGAASRPTGGISGCTASSGNPAGCARVFLGDVSSHPVKYTLY